MEAPQLHWARNWLKDLKRSYAAVDTARAAAPVAFRRGVTLCVPR